MNYSQCSICNERGHNQSKCPDLCSPLKPGFYSGGGTGGGHGGDDDDERALPQPILCLNPRLGSALELLQSPATTLENRLGTHSDSPLFLAGAATSLD